MKNKFMKFTEYLKQFNEQQNQLCENYDLIYQRMLDMLDDAHVDIAQNEISFNVGNVTNLKPLSDLNVTIRKDNTNTVTSERTDQTFNIVITTKKEIPNRLDIDSFLSHKNIYSLFRNQYKEYISNSPKTEDSESPIKLKMKSNTSEGFESAYNELVKEIDKKKYLMLKSVEIVDRDMQSAILPTRKKALEMAKDSILRDTLGSTLEEFRKLVMDLPQAKFYELLDKENKEKFDNRISSYFNKIQ